MMNWGGGFNPLHPPRKSNPSSRDWNFMLESREEEDLEHSKAKYKKVMLSQGNHCAMARVVYHRDSYSTWNLQMIPLEQIGASLHQVAKTPE